MNIISTSLGIQLVQADADAGATLSIATATLGIDESAQTVSVRITFDAASLREFSHFANNGRSAAEARAGLVAMLDGDEDRYALLKQNAWNDSRRELVSRTLHLAHLLTA